MMLMIAITARTEKITAATKAPLVLIADPGTKQNLILGQ